MHARAVQYADALWDAAKDLDAKAVRRLIDGFLELLAKRGHLPDATAVVEALEKRMRKESGTVEVTLTTAAPLAAADAKKVGAAIEKALGTEIALSTATDPALIGGAVLRTGDTLIDASARHRLEILKARLAE